MGKKNKQTKRTNKQKDQTNKKNKQTKRTNKQKEFHLKRFFSAYVSEVKKVYFMSRSFTEPAFSRTATDRVLNKKNKQKKGTRTKQTKRNNKEKSASPCLINLVKVVASVLPQCFIQQRLHGFCDRWVFFSRSLKNRARASMRVRQEQVHVLASANEGRRGVVGCQHNKTR